jgi:hypothetical protein
VSFKQPLYGRLVIIAKICGQTAGARGGKDGLPESVKCAARSLQASPGT